MLLWRKIWNYGKNFGTVLNTMVPYRKLWYYTENYGTMEKKDVTCTIPKTTEFFVTAVS